MGRIECAVCGKHVSEEELEKGVCTSCKRQKEKAELRPPLPFTCPACGLPSAKGILCPNCCSGGVSLEEMGPKVEEVSLFEEPISRKEPKEVIEEKVVTLEVSKSEIKEKLRKPTKPTLDSLERNDLLLEARLTSLEDALKEDRRGFRKLREDLPSLDSRFTSLGSRLTSLESNCMGVIVRVEELINQRGNLKERLQSLEAKTMLFPSPSSLPFERKEGTNPAELHIDWNSSPMKVIYSVLTVIVYVGILSWSIDHLYYWTLAVIPALLYGLNACFNGIWNRRNT